MSKFTPLETRSEIVDEVPLEALKNIKRSKYQEYINAALDGAVVKIVPEIVGKEKSIKTAIYMRLKKKELLERVSVSIADGAVYVFPYTPIL